MSVKKLRGNTSDGTSQLGEAFAVIVRFVGEEWTLWQFLVCMQNPKC